MPMRDTSTINRRCQWPRNRILFFSVSLCLRVRFLFIFDLFWPHKLNSYTHGPVPFAGLNLETADALLAGLRRQRDSACFPEAEERVTNTTPRTIRAMPTVFEGVTLSPSRGHQTAPRYTST